MNNCAAVLQTTPWQQQQQQQNRHPYAKPHVVVIGGVPVEGIIDHTIPLTKSSSSTTTHTLLIKPWMTTTTGPLIVDIHNEATTFRLGDYKKKNKNEKANLDGCAQEDSDSEMVGLADVPTDAMNVLLSCLTFSEYESLSLVSRRMNRAVSNATHLFVTHRYDLPSTSTTIPQQQPPDSATAPVTDTSRDSNTATSTATSTAGTGIRTVAIPEASSSIRPPVIIRMDVDTLGSLLDRYRNLCVLELEGLAPVGDKLFDLLHHASASQTLHSLSLDGINVSSSTKLRLSSLRHLRITNGSMRTASSFNAFIASSSSSSTSNGSNTSDPSDVECRSNLESLHVGQCSTIRDQQIENSITKHLHGSLRSLKLHQCLRIKKPVLQFANLESLSLMGCFALVDVPRFACPTLKHLDLSFCFRMSEMNIHLLIAKLPMLEILTLNKCPTLTKLVIQASPRTTNNTNKNMIRKIHVDYCQNLQFIQLRCPNLQSISNTECTSLKTVLIDEANCLQSFDIRSLPVTRLELFASNLLHLNLNGCRKLNDCMIHCPKLQKVKAKNCRTVALRFCKEVRRVIMNDWTKIPLEDESSSTALNYGDSTETQQYNDDRPR